MRSEDRAWLVAEDATAALRARLAAGALAQDLGFGEHRAGEVAIAASELAGNLGKHAREGTLVLRILRCGDAAGVELLAMDRGPGIADVDAVRADGYSSSGTLGIGLGAVERLSDAFAMHSVPGRGTVVAAAFWPPRTRAPVPSTAALLRPMAGERACGDAYAERDHEGARTLLLVDGLGHGPIAASAAADALGAFHDVVVDGPAAMLATMHPRLRHGRGAAAAIVQLHAGGDALSFAGVGNVAVWIVDGERRRGLLSQPGILGHTRSRLRELREPLPPQSAVVLHTDGLTSRWSLADYPGLAAQAPLLIAATLHRDAARTRDDTGVAVARAAA